MVVQGVTPLHIAAQIGHEAVAAALLKHGAPLTFGPTSTCQVDIACLCMCLNAPHLNVCL